MSLEDKLLSKIVSTFRNTYPETKGQLFHVSNERSNQKQALFFQSKGGVPGVSDLIYFYLGALGIRVLGLEVKRFDSYHEVYKIERQVAWGELLESKGGSWRLVRSLEEAISCLEGNLVGLTTKDVRKMLENCKTKSMQF